MGRIRTKKVKRVSAMLRDKVEAGFSNDFSKNKVTLKNKVEIYSKKMRNIIAGYISKLEKQQK